VINGLLGRKLGMVQVFDKRGRLRGATVIEAGPCLVTQIRTEERDGYQAIQLGYGAAKRTNKPMRGHLKRLGDLRHLREFPVEDASQHKVGQRIGAELFREGDHVDVTGISKGRGFAGSVKRHGFHGGPKTHGQSDRHRAPGAIGAGNTPGRVFKGMRMAGHMGAEKVTVRNLEVIESNPARGILIVAGAVPGARDGLVRIRYSSKTWLEARTRKLEELEREATAAAATDNGGPPGDDGDDTTTPDTSPESPAAEAGAPAEDANGDGTSEEEEKSS
jgi:large subunit ribosomal protein L3